MQTVIQSSFAQPANWKTFAEEPLVIHRRTQEPGKYLAVFVHGLGGKRYGSKSTWGDFPRLVFENFPNVDIGMYSYRTLFGRLKFWKSIRLEKEAEVFADLISDMPYEGFILLGHSTGGLLCKGVISCLFDTNRPKVAEKVNGLLLLASPQLGSTMVPNLFASMTTDFRALKTHSDYVTGLQQVFQERVHCLVDIPSSADKTHIPCWALIAAEDSFVDALSAGINLPSSQQKHIRGSHTSIVKPKDENHDGFAFVKTCILFATTKLERPFRREESYPARISDLKTINEFAQREFGERVSELQLMKRWWRVNDLVFHIISRVTILKGGRREEMVGYFCVIPLKGAVLEKLCKGEITGADIGAEFIAKQDQAPEAVYIGGVAGVDQASRGSALHFLSAHLNLFAEDKPVRVLTRPVTDDGLRVADGYGMTPVDATKTGRGHVYEVMLQPNHSLKGTAKRRRRKQRRDP